MNQPTNENTSVDGGDPRDQLTAPSPSLRGNTLKAGGRKTGESKKAYDVRRGFESGTLECSNEAHYRSETDPNNRTYTRVVRCSAVHILQRMEPFKRAKCECERWACKEGWSMNRPGTFNTEWVCQGAFHKGVLPPGAKYDPIQPPSRVMPVRYRLDKDSVSVLHNRFPGWVFVSTSSADHDHPISHTSTQVVTFEYVSSLKRGKRYLDLHGNPTANETACRDHSIKIDTVVNLESPGDYVRQATKWGAPGPASKPRYYTCAARDLPEQHPDLLAQVDDVFSIHTLYYYERKELADILAATKTGLMTAFCGRFKGSSGEMNNGEQQWRKEMVAGSSTVVQTNVKTGESYQHPDMEKWFDGTCFWSPNTPEEVLQMSAARRAEKKALAWTINMACEGTYKLTIVAVPLAATIVSGGQIDRPIHPICKDGGVTVKYCGTSMFYEIKPDHVDVFEHLRSRMNGKARTADKLKAHGDMALVKCTSVMKDKHVKATAVDIFNLTMATFWIDFERDLASAPSTFATSTLLAQQHAKAITGKGSATAQGALKKGLTVMQSALASKSCKSTFAALLGALADEL